MPTIMCESSAGDRISEGNRFIKEHKYKEAIGCFEEVLAVEPNTMVAWHGKAEALAMSFKYEEAITACNRAIDIEQSDGSNWFLRSFCCEMLGDYEQALQSCEKGLAIEPESKAGWCNRGEYLYALGRLEDALQSFATALRIDPDSEYTREVNAKISKWLQREDHTPDMVNKVLAFLRSVGYKEQLETYKHAVEVDPRGKAHSFEKDFALAHLEKPEEILAAHEKERQAKQPQLFIDISLKDFEFGHWSWVEVLITNKGNAVAREVIIVFPKQVEVKSIDAHPSAIEGNHAEEVGQPDFIAEILPGNQEKRLISLMPSKTGQYPLDIRVSYLDSWRERQEKTVAVWINVSQPGKQLPSIPDFTLLWKISSGNADIYVGKRRKDKISAIIKVPKLSDIESDFSTAFLKAASEWGNLEHPGIVRLYQYGDTPFPWIAMEYMDKGPLIRSIGSLSVPQSVQIALRIADSLVYSHRKHIYHRFINPSNILISSTDGVKLTNWRIATIMDKLAMKRNARGEEFMAYSAPEQVDTKFGGADMRTDVYQLGVLLYHMITGKLPFMDKGTKLAQQIKEEIPLSPGVLNREVNKQLDVVVSKCLAKDKDERYQNMSALKADLQLTAAKYPSSV